MSSLARFAAQAPVPLYAVVGDGSFDPVARLGVCEDVRFELSPRHASILLVCGAFRVADQMALKQLHDQLPHPRATFCWGCDSNLPMQHAEHLPICEDPLPGLRALYRALLTGERSSDAGLLPDQPPQPWEGRGDHGQGGEGMMGGAPYGRPMAMPDDDLRDGLQLDACTIRMGPYFPCWPPGLVLELTLQGDVVQQAQVLDAPYPPTEDAFSVTRRLGEVARLLFLLQLVPQAESVWRLACKKNPATPADVAALRRRLRRWGVFAAIAPTLGHLDAGTAEEMGLRCNGDGFSSIRTRLWQWLDEAEATASGSGGKPVLEHSQGAAASPHPIPHLADLLVGLEWHEARLVIASFDAMNLQRLASTGRVDSRQAPASEKGAD